MLADLGYHGAWPDKGDEMMAFKKLTDDILVSPQISVADLAAARAMGVTLIINNRPDDEDAGQPSSATIESAARALDMDYVTIPVTQAGFSQPQVQAMAKALDSTTGLVLAYCRSGTRSTRLWSLAEAAGGGDPAEISAIAGQAGYDVSDLYPMLEMLSNQA
jgi:uncharacterized protein (TIGR01244 family)